MIILSDLARKPFARFGSVFLLLIALAVVTFSVYSQVGNNPFLNFDDDIYVTNNQHVAGGITASNIIWAFTAIEANNWHPVTWLSHISDVELFGMNPRGHHYTSVVLHTISALLVLLLFFRLTGALWQSAFVAAMFSLHPLHVESVAWVAERKDVLSAMFCFLTLIFYSEYVSRKKTSLYIISLLTFLLGLMSKSMLVTIPIIMLLLDYWPLNRYRYNDRQGLQQTLLTLSTHIKEKIPFFVFSLLSAFITIYAQYKGGAMASLTSFSFRLRSENALITYLKYIEKIIWPHDLAILYPFPSSIPAWQVICSLLILLTISITAIRNWREYPYIAAGWFWFLITLAPVIGIIQVGGQSMADRYTYIPATGLFIIVAWGASDLTKRLKHQESVLALLAAMALVTVTVLTWQQLDYWRDNISLFRHTLQVTTGNSVIHYNLGHTLHDKGDLDGAILEYKEALRINPNNTDAHFNLGLALQKKGNLDDSIREYRMTLQLKPDDTEAHFNLGLVFTKKGELDAAISEYREILRINPYNRYAVNNLEYILGRKKLQDETK